MTGVTTINEANFTVDRENENIAIGISAKIESGSLGVALGHKASVEGTGGVAVGSGAKHMMNLVLRLVFGLKHFQKIVLQLVLVLRLGVRIV